MMENPCGGKEGDEKEECEADFEATKAEKMRIQKRERDQREKDRRANEKEDDARKKAGYEEGTLKMLATFNMTNPDDTVEY